MGTIKTELGDFSRDTSNHALINTNVNAFKLYKQQRENRNAVIEQDATVKALTKEIEDLRNMVKKLLEEKNG